MDEYFDEYKLFSATGDFITRLEVKRKDKTPIEVVIWNERVFNRVNGGFVECKFMVFS